MIDFLLQSLIPFFLSAIIVIVITLIAEKFGTKVGGILGTLPSTIIIAFIFIAINTSINFAATSASVVPGEMGINLIFLLLFALLCHYSFYYALIGSLSTWALLSTFLYFSNLNNLNISILLYIIAFLTSFFILEYRIKIPSISKRVVHYTATKIMLRGIIAGIVISISVLLSNIGAILSGIFSVFPAIFLSTMVISYKEHGPEFVGGMAKAMIFGTPSVTSYAISIYFLYPRLGIFLGTAVAYAIAAIITLMLFNIRSKLR